MTSTKTRSATDDLRAAEEAVRAIYWREIRLTAEDLAQRYREGTLLAIDDLVEQARARAEAHPWMNTPERAQFILACSQHADDGLDFELSTNPAVEFPLDPPVPTSINWSSLARRAFLEDVLDSLVTSEKLDLAPALSAFDAEPSTNFDEVAA